MPVRPRRGMLTVVAAAVAAAWLIALALLAVRTANPVTVNRAQLLASDAVVIAVPRSGPGGVSLTVERVLAGDGVPAELPVGGVEPRRFVAGGRFVVPLREASGGYVVTAAPKAIDGAPLVYPATDEAVGAAAAILSSAAAKPYE